MTLTKDRIASSLQAQFGITQREAAQHVDTVIDLIMDTLAGAEDLLISGVGKFSVKEKGQRRGRNPATGEPLDLGAKRVVTFRCSPLLKGKLNGGEER